MELKLSDLAGKTTQEQIAIAASFAGVEPTIVDRQWSRESQRGNPNFMLSPAGAQGHFGLMPNTRATWEKRLGVSVNPNDFTQSLFVAAHTMKENMALAKGDVGDALRWYNAGNPSRWNNDETKNYVDYVMGQPTPSNKTYTLDYLSAGSAQDLRDQRRKEFEAGSGARLTTLQKQMIQNRQISDIIAGKDPKRSEENVLSEGIGNVIAQDVQAIAKVANTGSTTAVTADLARSEGALVAEQVRADSVTAGQKFAAAFEENTATAWIMRAIEKQHFAPDETWNYASQWDKLEEGYTERERRQLRQSRSGEEYDSIVGRITEQRENNQKYTNTPLDAILYGVGAGVLDIPGWVVGAGVGKGLQLAGLGSRALMVAGRPMAAVASTMAEGVVGNVALEGIMDAAGDIPTLQDYAYAGGSGLIMGGVMAPFHFAGARSTELVDAGKAMQARAAEEMMVDLQAAANKVGPGASPERVSVALAEIQTNRMKEELDVVFAPLPEADVVFSLAGREGYDLEAREAMTAENSLEAKVADNATRNMVAEVGVWADRWNKANPIKPEFLRNFGLKAVGLEATATRLLSSENKVARAIGGILAESPTGAGGRRASVAMIQHHRERVYLEEFVPQYQSAFSVYSSARGGSLVDDVFFQRVLKDFDRDVYVEITNRGYEGRVLTEDRAVKEAADAMENAFERMRIEQQRAGTVGYARLNDSARGYITRRIAGDKLRAAPNTMREALVAHTEAQLTRTGWTPEVSKEFSVRYWQRAEDRSMGAYDTPVNLSDPDAADIVDDMLEAKMKAGEITYEEMRDMQGKFSRGGAGHTKGRIDLDVMQSFTDKDGNSARMLDFLTTDPMALTRQYARRVSGEVALAQYGIMGKPGMKLLREALVNTGEGSTKATEADLRAFDQLAAETLNTPFGKHLGKNMDNIRMATAASRLGGMAFTQAAEQGNAVAMLGVARALQSIPELGQALKDVREIGRGTYKPKGLLKDIEIVSGVVGSEDYRQVQMFEVRDNAIQEYGREKLNVLDKATRAMANAMPMLTGQRAVTAGQTRAMGQQIVRKAVAYIKSGADDAALDDMGITKAMREALRPEIDRMATFDANGKLVQFELLEANVPLDVKRDFSYAVNRGAHQIIQRTYNGETGKWAHDGLLKFAMQFRTFSVVAAEKQAARVWATQGAAVAAGTLAASMTFALPIHLARTQMRAMGMSESERDNFLDKETSIAALTRATLQYASIAGLSADGADLATAVIGGWAGEAGIEVNPSFNPRGGGRDITGMVPALGYLNDVMAGVQGNPHRLLKAAPGNNHPFVQPFVNEWKSED